MATNVRVVLCAFRLWGDHGQETLENAHVCLINATATGTEILKNLVLPGEQIFLSVSDLAAGDGENIWLNELFCVSGIGAFTIVDGHTVTGEDVGNK